MTTPTGLLKVEGLPEAPLAAAADFHARVLPGVLAALDAAGTDDLLCLHWPAAGHEHREWRLAAVQSLARQGAPARVNAIEGGTEAQIAAALDWLCAVPGVTGQLLALDPECGADTGHDGTAGS